MIHGKEGKLQIVQSGLNKNTEMSSRMYFQRKPGLLTVQPVSADKIVPWKKSKYRICYILTYSYTLIQYLELDSLS